MIVGKRTALVDNPRLDAREWPGRNPIRILIDKNLEIPAEYHLYNDAAKTIIFNELKTDVEGNVHFVQMEDMQYYLPQKIAFQLYLMDIQSVIIDGGANLLHQFISAGLWDEARVFTSSLSWEDGILSPQINGVITDVQQIGSDQLSIYQNKSKL
ncbi:2,5-diamino-6-ribosylamino-4(3H)-pyrimidinone 5'-phosphate reductase [compost metagenome]